MQNEIYWLTLTLLATGLMWVPYVLNLFFVNGIIDPVFKPYSGDFKPLSKWAERARAAHYNAVENLVVFAPLVVLCHIYQDKVNIGAVVIAAMIYFFVRILHYIVYVLGLPGLRTVFFLVGVGVNVFLALQVLGALAG